MGQKSDAVGHLRVIALEADNFMRLKAVRIYPRGDVVEIVGKNGAGKSSVLDSIFSTICGAAAVPEKPVRAGEAAGETFVDLGEYRVTRSYTALTGATALKVESRDGTRVKSPQAVLDALVSLVAFDPLEFAGAKPEVQAETLRKLVGLDLSDLDRQKAGIAEERSALAKSIKAEEFAYNAFGPDAEYSEVPDDPVSMAGLAAELRRAHDEQRKINDRRQAYRLKVNEQRAAISASEKANEAVAKARRRLDEAEAESAAAVSRLATLSGEIEAERPAVDALADPDTSAITQRMADAEDTNRHVRRKAERKAAGESLAANRQHMLALLSDATAVRIMRANRIAACTFPLTGVTLDEDGSAVLLDGIPVSQASTARAIVLGLSVAAAANPRLRVALIKDGSLLDDDTMDAVKAWASVNDMQLWVERVGGPGSPSGVIIEDGAVLADRQPGEQPATAPRFGAAAVAALDGLDSEPEPGQFF